MKCENFGETWLDMDLPFPCEIHHRIPRESKNPFAKRVLSLFSEPKALVVQDGWIRDNYNKFDLIVGYGKTLSDLPNYQTLYFGSCWCDRLPHRKEFSVSFLLSTGCGSLELEGYDLRKAVPMALAKSIAPARLFVSSRRLTLQPEEIASLNALISEKKVTAIRVDDDKLPLFESMFHVAIENADNEIWFTEKIVDCFRTFTLPIYYGTKAISEIFDKDGIIFVRDVADIEAVLSRLSLDDYYGRFSSMRKNYEIAGQFLDPVENLRKILIDKLGT